MSNIQDAIYTVVYDNGTELSHKCKVNMETWQMFDVEHVEHDNDADYWVNQYVTLQDGKEYDVHWVEYEYLGNEDYNYFWFE